MNPRLLKITFISWLFCFFGGLAAEDLLAPDVNPGAADADQSFAFQVDTASRVFSKVNCLFLCVGRDEDERLLRFAKLIKSDLEITDQLDIDLKRADAEPDVAVLPKLFEKGTSLFASLKDVGRRGKDRELLLVVKEPSSQANVFEKKFTCNDHNLVLVGHQVANEILPALTGQKAPLLCTLVYSKQVAPRVKVLYASDLGGKVSKLLFNSSTINVAPRAHTQVPLVFFSQFTRSNTRLMSHDLRTGKRKVVCSYDGLNMQPSFSEDGVKAVLCLSASGNSELFMYDQRECNAAGRRVFTQLTSNKGNNASPSLLPNGDVIFCSDFETGYPQIYYLDRKTNTTRRLTNGRGYCAAPSYCQASNSIVYCRQSKGAFQLFAMNLSDGRRIERQLTTVPGDKQEPVWSPDGRFVAFSYDCIDKETKRKASQIAIMNIDSKKIRVVTSGKENKSFPCWVTDSYYI